MHQERNILQRLDALPEPRHLFILPDWAPPSDLDVLIRDGYLTCQYQQRDEKGALLVAMGLLITPKGERLLRPRRNIWQLFVRSSLAGASFAAMSLLILYLA